MSPEASALIKMVFYGVTSLGYMIGMWTADDEDTERHRATIFWITLVGAGVVGILIEILRAVSK